MEDPNLAARRLIVGVSAVVLLTAAVVLWIWPGLPNSGAVVTWRAACVRVGTVMAALWLALPSQKRAAAWANLNPLTVAGFIIAVLALRLPLRILLPLAAAVLIIGVVLRPRRRERPSRPDDFRS